jgi:hypothetical protein
MLAPGSTRSAACRAGRVQCHHVSSAELGEIVRGVGDPSHGLDAGVSAAFELWYTSTMSAVGGPVIVTLFTVSLQTEPAGRMNLRGDHARARRQRHGL